MATMLYGFGAALLSGVQKVLPGGDSRDIARLTGDLERIEHTLEGLHRTSVRAVAVKRPAEVLLASLPKRIQLER